MKNQKISNNLWNADFISDLEIEKNIEKLNEIKQAPLDTHVLYEALGKMSELLRTNESYHRELVNALCEKSNESFDDVVKELEDLLSFINVDHLRKKLKRELGDENPFEIKRVEGRSKSFEAYYPLGVLVHITPNNSAVLSTCALIEGLLSGNVNILKLGRKEGSFCARFFHKLCELDHTKELKKYIYIAQVSSKKKELVKKLISHANAVSSWGNEESVDKIKAMLPKNVRFIEWGHKISFSYFSKKMMNDEISLKRLGHEICQNNQLFCSSPQCVYVEEASFEELKLFGEKLAIILQDLTENESDVEISDEDYAEITVTKEVLKLRSIDEDCAVIEDDKFRIYIDDNAILKASPLYKTIWLKSLKKKEITHIFNGLESYLQTLGLACDRFEFEELCRAFLQAGVLRIRPVGEMLSSYEGEPHDGEYALARFCKKINIVDSNNEYMKHKYSFETKIKTNIDKRLPIMEKSDFQKQFISDEYSDLFFHSGGSSGKPKMSIFTYADYYRQMEMAAEGLFAAGLEPDRDRVMNLFYAGNLYGGFTSFFTILEKLNVVQFPMGASTDFELVGKTIVNNKVNTLIGMPSYLLELFRKNAELFKKHKVVKKIFFGGEHFSQTQRDYLIKEYGLDYIRSASYGSVDAGPLAYQCEFSKGRLYHLHEKLHDLEIVDLEKDQDVIDGEIGRLLFSSKVRHGQNITRYAIGDIGKKVLGQCECGRSGVRFELFGRHGDIFRIGTIFLSYQKFEKILIDTFSFEGQFQLQLFSGDKLNKEKVILLVEDSIIFDEHKLREKFINLYDDLKLVVLSDAVLDFEVKVVEKKEFVFNEKTGKLKTVIDYR